jgi:hypothetical protein
MSSAGVTTEHGVEHDAEQCRLGVAPPLRVTLRRACTRCRATPSTVSRCSVGSLAIQAANSREVWRSV